MPGSGSSRAKTTFLPSGEKAGCSALEARFLLPVPSAFITPTSEYFVPEFLTQAILVPPGEKAGSVLLAGDDASVNCLVPVPSGLIVKIW